jgi:hypothetical protein
MGSKISLFDFNTSAFKLTVPKDGESTLTFLESHILSLIISTVVTIQYCVVASSEIGQRQCAFMNIIISFFFLTETSIRLLLTSKFKQNPLHFFSSPVNCADTLIVFLDVVVIVVYLLSSEVVGKSSSAIKLARVVRLARLIPHGSIRALRSLRVAVALETYFHRGEIKAPTFEHSRDNSAKDDVTISSQKVEFQFFDKDDDISQKTLILSIDDEVSFSGVRGVKYGDLSIYQGDWVNGFEEGSGQLSFSNGDIFKGGFKRGLFHSRGRIFFANGDTFRGSFLKGKKHGAGKYTFADGDVFEAFYQNGKLEGKSHFCSTDGQKLVYYFCDGEEVPPPEELDEQKKAAANFKGLDFRELLTPGDKPSEVIA